MESHWVYNPYLKEAPRPAIDGQPQINSMAFGGTFFISYCFAWAFFPLPIFYLYIMFPMLCVFFGGVALHVCMCFSCFIFKNSVLVNVFISCLFSKERQKRGTELDGGEDLEGDEGRGDCDLNILYEKVFIFNKNIHSLTWSRKKLNLYKDKLGKNWF